MEIVIARDRPQLGQYSASIATFHLKKTLQNSDVARLIVATGSSQFELLDELVQTTGIDWSRVDGFHLDEYVNIDRNHPASFCNYLKQRFVSRLGLRSFHYLTGSPDSKTGSQDPQNVCEIVNRRISEFPVDVALVGIGENGHLAFNDPPADFETDQPYLVVELDEACRRQQVGEGWFERLDQVPKQAFTMSIRQILSTRHIVCTVPDHRKAEAVVKSIEGPVTPSVPASILQLHRSVTLVLDLSSASLLSDETRKQCKQL